MTILVHDLAILMNRHRNLMLIGSVNFTFHHPFCLAAAAAAAAVTVVAGGAQ